MNISYDFIEDEEPDAGLGNGGLGRLAACFLDSLATLEYPGHGYGIRYEYGMFEQHIINGEQVEFPDNWLKHRDPWEVKRSDLAVTVKFGGQIKYGKTPDGQDRFYLENAEEITATPYDMPIVAYGSNTVNTLRLWQASSPNGFDLQLFNDGRIHTRFNQVETRTGRISSLEPNLQNIPIRTELGSQMRKFFIAGEGKKLVDADYSQIELRVLSDLSGDENMINAFNSGEDIHTITASQVFNLPVQMVTPQMRSRAKAVNFGIVYGIGAFSLAKDIGVSNKEAKQYIENYLAHYSGVDDYMKKMIDLAKDKGYSETLFHRKRYLPELASSNHMMRAFGERVARNMPIQGTAADIIKIAMVKVDKRLSDENMKSRLILQVHDELIVEAPENEAQKALEIVTEEMENACKMKVLLRADGKIGNTWFDAH